FCGRNSQNKMVVFPKKEGLKPGDYVHVRVREATSATLLGNIV
ncbi:MAG TPA: TRAM domain-containing protein, partial [Saprospiraceae bacterium]|nr:TRAM domain-containing protein [Saprospiraceae bacterium]